MAITQFLLGLEEKSCGDKNMAKGRNIEHWKCLVIDLRTGGLGYWFLIINLGQ